ncbi:MAG: helix-turn-helix domain-containing protein [Victivallales bacterium]|nr:helix-turn-helix domain-containing protein [Victivallales bacterium]
MQREIYTLMRMSKVIKGTIADFPISFYEMIPGRQVPEVFHDHEFIEVVVVYNGTGNHIVNGHSAPIREGDVLLLYPHDIHGFTECKTLGLLNIMYVPSRLPFPVLDGDRMPLFQRFFPMEQSPNEFRSNAEPILHFTSHEDMEYVAADARRLGQELASLKPGNMMCSIIRLLSVITLILRFGQPLIDDPEEHRHFTMGKILDYLNKNYMHEISQRELCKMAACSPSTFQRRFKKLTGYRPTEYIIRKRITMAQTLLLKEPDLAIAEIGFACGFIDNAYFSRKFRLVTGVTPQKWRLSKGNAGIKQETGFSHIKGE